MQRLSYEPLIVHLFKMFKRALKPKTGNDNSKKKNRDSEESLDQAKRLQRVRK